MTAPTTPRVPLSEIRDQYWFIAQAHDADTLTRREKVERAVLFAQAEYFDAERWPIDDTAAPVTVPATESDLPW